MIGRKERLGIWQEESFSVCERGEADKCIIGKAGGVAVMGS